MVWPFNRNKKAEPVIEKDEPSPRPLLEDLPPKFQDLQQEPPKPSITQELKKVQLQDFKPENLVQIPCFREAGISGFTTMAVFGTVMFFYHKNIRKAVNWAYGGFFFGSIIGWEHCNSVRRQSQATAAIAKKLYEDKQKLKLAAKYKEFLETKKKD